MAPTFEEFILTVLKHSDTLKTNWKEVAAEYGYSRPQDT